MNHAITISFTAAVIAAIAATAAASGQTTSSAAALPEISVNVWTCSAHEELRMRSKGVCPFCEQDLVRTKVVIQGEGAIAPYPLATCPVSGLELGESGEPVILVHEGREVRFCCANCVKKFRADPAAYLATIDKAIVEKQKASYPMTTCPISHEPLGSMGEPVDLVYQSRLVRFCCNGCVRQFKKDPSAALAELDQAILAAQVPQYPLAACPVSKQGLTSMGGPVDLVAGNRLVRFCCAGCATAFYKAPAVYIDEIDKAWTKRPEGHDDHGHDNDGHDHDHDH